MPKRLVILALLAILASSGVATAQQATPGVLYATSGVNGTPPGGFFSIAPSGAATFIGPTGFTGGVPGLAIDSAGNVYGSAWVGAATVLIRINPATGAGTLVGAMGGIFEAIAFDENNVLYGTTALAQTLHIINTATGAAGPAIGGVTGQNNLNGASFRNCVTNTEMWVSQGGGAPGSGGAGSGNIYRLNDTTNVPTLVGNTGLGGSVPDLQWIGTTLYGLSSSGGTGTFHNLITINSTTGAGTIVGSTGFPAMSGMAARITCPQTPTSSYTASMLLGMLLLAAISTILVLRTRASVEGSLHG